MDIHHPDLHPLFADHVSMLKRRSDEALARAGFDHLLIPAGTLHYQFLDDRDYPFCVNPHFKHWLPVTHAPGSWLVYSPGHKPKLIYLQPADYWHVVPEEPAGYWVEHFEIITIREPDEALAHLPKEMSRCAIIGEPQAALGNAVPNNPQAVIDYLHYHRMQKTAYELAMMRVASKIGARAHRAAEAAFRNGASEFDIHMAYLASARQTEHELPYSNIICLNEHAAILHYHNLQHAAPARLHSFLIDAGASFHGYASDITRTYSADANDEFQALVDSMDTMQQGLCARVRKDQDYAALHVDTHRLLGGILKQHGIIHGSAESAVASGITSAFFPHGLGHPIGLQVHDVAAFAANESGQLIARPEGHPYLRMTRTLQPGAVVTIEPGLYFIDMLLARLRETPAAKDVAWDRVDALRKFGGIRIEDDVVCTEGDPENLTRDAFGLLDAS